MRLPHLRLPATLKAIITIIIIIIVKKQFMYDITLSYNARIPDLQKLVRITLTLFRFIEFTISKCMRDCCSEELNRVGQIIMVLAMEQA